VFAGDPTLHDLITENGLSDGALQEFAREELERDGTAVMVLSGEELQLKTRIRLAKLENELAKLENEMQANTSTKTLQIAKDQLETEKTKSDTEKTKSETYMVKVKNVQAMGDVLQKNASESTKVWVQQSLTNFQISMYAAAMGTNNERGLMGIENGAIISSASMCSYDMDPMSISTDILIPKGIADPNTNIAIQIGKIAARMYRDANENQDPPQRKALIQGTYIWVKSYYRKDLPLLEDAYLEYKTTADADAVQKVEKAAAKEKKTREAKSEKQRVEKEKAAAKADKAAAKEEKTREAKSEKQRVENEKAEAKAEKGGLKRKSRLDANESDAKQMTLGFNII
jgi:hypothetical protein